VAFDEQLGARIRGVLGARPDVEEKRMFGGLAFELLQPQRREVGRAVRKLALSALRALVLPHSAREAREAET
jgi:hypothetical protein